MAVSVRRGGRRLVDKTDDEAVAARGRVMTMIDAIPPADLVASIKRAPSLRGMILGYIAEEMFEKHLPARYDMILAEHIEAHDDHDRSVNKSDRTVTHKGRRYGIQLKSMQTASIGRTIATGVLQADVQNDASDMRAVILSDGSSIITTCYLRGEYDILAVPLFPFTGTWDYAYKLNADCRACNSRKYDEFQAGHLLATTEKITWPLGTEWHENLLDLLNDGCGYPIGHPDVVVEPGGEIRVSEAAAVILPLEN